VLAWPRRLPRSRKRARACLIVPGRGRVVTGQPPHDPEVVEGVGLAQPVAEVAVLGQGLLQVLGRARVVTR